ncbi:MAG: single-stranded DNA-binding protein [Bacilli bacterium]|nr:single-stranded DNA-binding protein [Bacilli bacterium]
MNKVFLIGRLTRDPELRYLSNNNTPVATFSIAINRSFENQNGQREADFINIVAWRKQAENVKKYIVKGALVAIDGRIQTRNYDDKDGKKIYITEVVADNVQFLESKGQRSQSVSPQDFNGGYENQAANTTDISNEPFADFGDTIELSEDDIAF